MKITKIVAGLVLMGIMTSGFANQGDSTGSSLGTTGTVMSNPTPGIGLVTDTTIANKINLNNFLINEQLKIRDAQTAALVKTISNMQAQIDAIKTSGGTSGSGTCGQGTYTSIISGVTPDNDTQYTPATISNSITNTSKCGNVLIQPTISTPNFDASWTLGRSFPPVITANCPASYTLVIQPSSTASIWYAITRIDKNTMYMPYSGNGAGTFFCQLN